MSRCPARLCPGEAAIELHDGTAAKTDAGVEGTPALCVHCGALMIFTGVGLETREATDRELLDWTPHPSVVFARRQLRAIWAERRRHG
jgi:hypothetical protein